MLSETSSYLIAAGGKRFRAMLVLLAGYFGDPTDPRLIPGSVSIELVHLATLYHDDVIDEADARRGAPSANVRWDNTVAILTGDYLFARASEISTDLGVEVCRLLARTIAILCDGQIREVDSSASVEQPIDELPRDHPAEDRFADRHLVPAGSHALGRRGRARGHPGGVRRRPRHGLSSCPTTSWTSRPPRWSSARSPARTCREGVYTLPVLRRARRGRAPRGARADPRPRGARRGDAGPRARDRPHGGLRRPCAAGGHGRGRACDGARAPPPGGPRAARVDPAREVPGGPVRRGARGVSALLESGRSRNLSQT